MQRTLAAAALVLWAQVLSAGLVAPPARWALIVAVDAGTEEMERGGEPERRIEQARRLADLLHRDFGYRSANLVALYGREATSAAIYRSVDELEQRIRRDDSLLAVFFTPSGQFETRGGPESYIVSFGLREGLSTRISIAELNAMVGRVAARGEAGLLVLGGCQAGLRSPSAVQLDLKQRAYLPQPDLQLLSGCAPDTVVRGGRTPAKSFAATLVDTLERLAAGREPISAGTLRQELEAELRAARSYLRVSLETQGRRGSFAFVPEAAPRAAATLESSIADPEIGAEARVAAIARLVAVTGELADAERAEGTARAVDLLLAVAADSGDSLAVRNAALGALAALAEPAAIPGLGRIVGDPAAPRDPVTGALAALERIGGDEVVPHVEAALDAEDPAVLLAAIEILTRLGSRGSLGRILEASLAERRDDGRQADPAHDSRVKLAALEAAQRLGGAAEVGDWAAGLLDPERNEPEVRSAAVRALGEAGEPRAQPRVVERLGGDHDPQVRQAAAWALGRLPGADRRVSARALLAALEDPSPLVREAAAVALGQVGGSQAVAPLAELVVSDPAFPVRSAAAEALGALGDPAAVEALGRALDDADASVGRAAAFALAEIASPEAAWRLQGEAVRGKNPVVRKAAVAALDRLESQGFAFAVDPVAVELAGPLDPHLQAEVLERLAAAGDPGAVPRLVAALAAEDFEVRQAAIAGLGAMPGDAAIPALEEALAGGGPPLGREGAAEALGRGGRPQALQVLLRYSEDPDLGVRAAAVRALGHFVSEPAEGAVLAAAESGEPELMLAAAGALSQQGVQFYRQGSYAQGIERAGQALRIREKIQGPEHPDVAYELNNLAALLRQQGDLERTEDLLRRSLEIRERALGGDHPVVAVSLNNLAQLYTDRGDFEPAESLFFRALKIREYSLGAGPEVAQSLENLARLYQRWGREKEAAMYFERAREVEAGRRK